MGVFGQAANPFRGAPEERLGQENSFLGVGPQGAGPPPKKKISQIQKSIILQCSKIGVTPVGLI